MPITRRVTQLQQQKAAKEPLATTSAALETYGAGRFGCRNERSSCGANATTSPTGGRWTAGWTAARSAVERRTEYMRPTNYHEQVRLWRANYAENLRTRVVLDHMVYLMHHTRVRGYEPAHVADDWEERNASVCACLTRLQQLVGGAQGGANGNENDDLNRPPEQPNPPADRATPHWWPEIDVNACSR